MVKMETKNIAIGMIILLLVSGTTYVITNELDKDYNLYECHKEEPAVAMLCWKLSNVNSGGLQTRCYWNMSASKRYKVCSTGWLLSDKLEIEGEETSPDILPNTEHYEIKSEWTNKQESEDYIDSLKQEVTYTTDITNIEQYPYSNSITVIFKINIIKDGDIIDTRVNIIPALDTDSKQVIEALVAEEANRMFESWEPYIIIDRGDLIS